MAIEIMEMNGIWIKRNKTKHNIFLAIQILLTAESVSWPAAESLFSSTCIAIWSLSIGIIYTDLQSAE
jgi:hypothetical protein